MQPPVHAHAPRLSLRLALPPSCHARRSQARAAGLLRPALAGKPRGPRLGRSALRQPQPCHSLCAPCLALPCFALPCFALSCFALPCLAGRTARCPLGSAASAASDHPAGPEGHGGPLPSLPTKAGRQERAVLRWSCGSACAPAHPSF